MYRLCYLLETEAMLTKFSGIFFVLDGNFVALVVLRSSLIRDLETSCNLDKESFIRH